MSRNYKFHNPEGACFVPANAGFVSKQQDEINKLKKKINE